MIRRRRETSAGAERDGSTGARRGPGATTPAVATWTLFRERLARIQGRGDVLIGVGVTILTGVSA